MCGKKCSFCGKDGVKLWQGMIHESVLVCASCAEKRQLKKQVCEYKWVEEDGGYKGTPTGENKVFDPWKIDENGEVELLTDGRINGWIRYHSKILPSTKITFQDSSMMLGIIPYEYVERLKPALIGGITEEEWRKLPTR